MATDKIGWFLELRGPLDEHLRLGTIIRSAPPNTLCLSYASPKMRTDPFLFSIRLKAVKSAYLIRYRFGLGNRVRLLTKGYMLEGQVIQNIGRASPSDSYLPKGENDMRSLPRTNRLRVTKSNPTLWLGSPYPPNKGGRDDKL